MTLEYPQEIYPKEVLIKAAFKFLDQAYIHIDKDYGKYIVSISIGIWDCLDGTFLIGFSAAKNAVIEVNIAAIVTIYTVLVFDILFFDHLIWIQIGRSPSGCTRN